VILNEEDLEIEAGTVEVSVIEGVTEEAEEDLGVIVHDSEVSQHSKNLEIEMMVQKKCTQQPVQSVAKNVRFHFDQTVKSQYFVRTVSIHKKNKVLETLHHEEIKDLTNLVLTSHALIKEIDLIDPSEISLQQHAQLHLL
jgi:hypothetical protein